MSNEIREFMVQKVNELINAPSCCPEAKQAGKDWLEAPGTEGEKVATKKLIEELKEDVSSIDGLISLLKSEQGKAIFGEETAAKMLIQAEESKKTGGKYCICPACQAGGAILDLESELLK